MGLTTKPDVKETRAERKVHFSESVRMRLALHIQDYSRKEIKASWYTEKESNSMKNKAMAIVRRAKEGLSTWEDLEGMRGLEIRLPSQKRNILSRRLTAQVAVFQQQQQAEQPACPQRIAEAYRPLSQVCQKEAYERGQQDHKEVCNILREDSLNVTRRKVLQESAARRSSRSILSMDSLEKHSPTSFAMLTV